MPEQTITRRQIQTRAPADRRWLAPFAWLRRTVPTALIALGLGGIAYWGYRNEWTMPKFGSLVGRSPEAAEKWCLEHNVAWDDCIECDASLLPAGPDYGWCREHGVSQCPLDHSDVAQLKNVPEITPADLSRARRALDTFPRAENDRRSKLYRRRLQFASEQAVEKADIDIAVVEEQPLTESLSAYGEVLYDETRTAHLASRVPGSVWRVEKKLGDPARQGDVLLLVDAAEVGRAKAEFLQALAQARLKRETAQRMDRLGETGAVAGRQQREARAQEEEADIRLRAAQQALVNLGLPVDADDFDGVDHERLADQLRFLGLPPALTQRLDAKTTTSNLWPLVTPLDGVVVKRSAVAGEVVDNATTLFMVVDTSRMWVVLDVRQEDAQLVALGQKVLFRPDDRAAGADLPGSVSWISTEVAEPTHTVRVRVEASNDDGRLRANTFGTGRIVLREEPRAIVVPSEAVHWDGSCHVVFVRDKDYLLPDSPKFFHVRQVRLGAVEGDLTEIIVGLLPGEVIAAKNSVVLEAQLLKSNLGEGCGCCSH